MRSAYHGEPATLANIAQYGDDLRAELGARPVAVVVALALLGFALTRWDRQSGEQIDSMRVGTPFALAAASTAPASELPAKQFLFYVRPRFLLTVLRAPDAHTAAERLE
jgi:hypothetical protein